MARTIHRPNSGARLSRHRTIDIALHQAESGNSCDKPAEAPVFPIGLTQVKEPPEALGYRAKHDVDNSFRQPPHEPPMSLAALSTSGWDRQLIEKYDVAGPRYTSYPTALQFNERFGAEDYRRLWQRQSTSIAPSIAPLSLYFHIPFCENICYYCACNKVVTRQKEKARHYLNYLEKEIALQSALVGSRRPVTQMHWGGGTPTFLDAAELTELMHAIASHFHLLDNDSREYAIEVDPRTVDRQRLALLKGLGFNRISLGIQDFDERVQRAINRVQSPLLVQALVEATRAFGFKSLGFDLIYGLPYQSVDSLRRTLDQVLELGPDRIALYNYAHLPARFPSQRAIDRLTLPSAAEKLSMAQMANETLTAAGYVHIGMDHFVRAQDELALAQRNGHLQRNFQGYSICMAPDLIGMGVSAISSTADAFAQNSKSIDDYCARLDRGELPIERGLWLDDDDRIRRHVIAEIICNLGIDFDALDRRFGIDSRSYFRGESEALAALAGDGLIQLDNNRLQVTPRGRPLLRVICMVFDRYSAQAPAQRFSRVL
jgi:oxygen-independent coproporphyrinogen-3 oxidase